MGLAEPKKREILAADPRNTNWSGDKGRFGFRMLEKMGWSEGKGLGAQEDGVREHVKIKLKTNSFGVGADKKNIRNWLANADGFSELLDRLNSGNNTPAEEASSPAASASENSQTLNQNCDAPTEQARPPQVARQSHRARFRRMKQMAMQDQKGLQEIFGVRSAPATVAASPMAIDSADEFSDTVIAVSTQEASKAQPLQIISTGVTVTDYFAQKMANNPALAAIYGHSSSTKTLSIETPASPLLDDESDSAHDDTADSEASKTRSSSKKRKSSLEPAAESSKKSKKDKKDKKDKKIKDKKVKDKKNSKDTSKSKSKSKSKDKQKDKKDKKPKKSK
ncbi:hypothetical protein IW140_003118 [Coemansia sp. RSA 1813]|nr:hypothetical protein LPJ74_004737 [Coemansia sp. RSA 1843]KAJ2214532.1 hypothetical protein EV179_002937 [Coemansia sp. RSA 487]KAJ2569415.1 hypothetical protein IW140_003118 [Coemansia sp. RSA 1813]